MGRTQVKALALLAFALGCGITNTVGARPIRIPPVGSDALENRCNDAGGHFEKHQDGTYLCRFPNGKTITCDPDGVCIEYLRTPGGGRGPLIVEPLNGDVLVR